MSLSHSPKIVTNGLTFYYDMNNKAKSWKGMPTTNIANGSFDTSFDTIADNDTVGFVNQLGTGNFLGVSSNFAKYGNKSLLVNRGTGGTGRVYRTFTVLAGEVNSVSAWVWSTVPGPYIAMEYNGGDYTWSIPYTKNIHTGKGWELLYANTAVPATSNTTGYYFLYPIVENTNTYWDCIQLEKSAFNSPYVSDTRTNTQSLIDLVGNTTITVNSLTYDSNNTFSFNAAGNYISLPDNLYYENKVSIFAWIKILGNPRGGYHIISGPTLLELSILSAGTLRTGVVTSVNRYVSNHGSNLNDGNWHYIGFTFDGINKNSYIDGNYVGTLPVSGILTKSATNRAIGVLGQGDATYGMNGYISSVQIYNTALSDDDVLQNFNALKLKYNI